MAGYDDVAASICRALRSGIPFLRLGGESPPLVLAYRRRGETIEDPDCDEDYRALESRVFRRFPATVGGRSTFRWLGLCHLTEGDVGDLLRTTVDRGDLDAIAVDLAFQTHRWDGVRAREARRERTGQPEPNSTGGPRA